MIYKAFFRFDKYWRIPIQAFYVRLTGIPDFILIASPRFPGRCRKRSGDNVCLPGAITSG